MAKILEIVCCFILVTPIRFIDCEALGLGRLWGVLFTHVKMGDFSLGVSFSADPAQAHWQKLDSILQAMIYLRPPFTCLLIYRNFCFRFAVKTTKNIQQKKTKERIRPLSLGTILKGKEPTINFQQIQYLSFIECTLRFKSPKTPQETSGKLIF